MSELCLGYILLVKTGTETSTGSETEIMTDQNVYIQKLLVLSVSSVSGGQQPSAVLAWT